MRSPAPRLNQVFLLGGGLALACSHLLGISDPLPRSAAGSSGLGPDERGGADDGGASAGRTTSGGGGQVHSAGGLGGHAAGGDSDGGAGASAGDNSLGGMGGRAGDGGSAGSTHCTASERQCAGNEVQRCENGDWRDEQECAAYCVSGACITPPSCGLLGTRTCGDSASCCRALEVPGGSFIRDYDGKQYTSPHFAATISTFLMDRFEVSVGRFAAFVNAFPNLELKEGDGKSPRIPDDLGWRDSYPLPKTSEELLAELHCPNTTWVDSEDGDLNLPANCVDFYTAYAFCIWDQGRLPTEAEWNYAAAGGDEQREFPWSVNGDSGLDLDHANYGGDAGSALPIAVGTKPKGNGRWGHSDLSGNVNEWTLDYYTQVYASTVCRDCVNQVAQPTRTTRGGAYAFNESAQKVDYRTSGQPNTPRSYTGFRCVRDLPSSVQN